MAFSSKTYELNPAQKLTEKTKNNSIENFELSSEDFHIPFDLKQNNNAPIIDVALLPNDRLAIAQIIKGKNEDKNPNTGQLTILNLKTQKVEGQTSLPEIDSLDTFPNQSDLLAVRFQSSSLGLRREYSNQLWKTSPSLQKLDSHSLPSTEPFIILSNGNIATSPNQHTVTLYQSKGDNAKPHSVSYSKDASEDKDEEIRPADMYALQKSIGLITVVPINHTMNSKITHWNFDNKKENCNAKNYIVSNLVQEIVELCDGRIVMKDSGYHSENSYFHVLSLDPNKPQLFSYKFVLNNTPFTYVKQLLALPGKPYFISVCKDGTAHLWKVNESSIECSRTMHFQAGTKLQVLSDDTILSVTANQNEFVIKKTRLRLNEYEKNMTQQNVDLTKLSKGISLQFFDRSGDKTEHAEQEKDLAENNTKKKIV